MKTSSTKRRFVHAPGVLAVFVVVAMACTSLSQPLDLLLNINTFDNAAFTNGFWDWWGFASKSWSFDPAKDADGNTNSGSVKFQIGFSGSALGDNQYSIGMAFSGTDPYDTSLLVHRSNFENLNLEFDVLWDTHSTFPLSTFTGTVGIPDGFGVGLIVDGYGQYYFPNAAQPVLSGTGTWEHVELPVDYSSSSYSGLFFTKWFPSDTNFTGTATFWVDNIRFLGSQHINYTTPAIERPVHGLNLFAGLSSDQFGRENIRARQTDFGAQYSWIGRGTNPVSYSFTVASYPGNGYENFETHIFIVPAPSSHVPSVDYFEPNVLAVTLYSASGGLGVWSFRAKTNIACSAGYCGLELGRITNSTVLGTWTLSFLNDTNVTLKTPANTATNFNLDPDVAALFNGPVDVYFGVMPNEIGNIGQAAALSNARIQGSSDTLDDNFLNDAALDTSVWEVAAAYPAGVIFVPANSLCWVNWFAVARPGWFLQANPDLTNPGGWFTNGLPEPVQIRDLKWTLITSSNVPPGNSMFFRLARAWSY